MRRALGFGVKPKSKALLKFGRRPGPRGGVTRDAGKEPARRMFMGSKLTIGEAARLEQHMGGTDLVRQILARAVGGVKVKYDEVTLGQVEAFINAAGGLDAFRAVLAGDKTICLEDVIKLLADQNGRNLPVAGLNGKVVDANRNYRFVIEQGDCEMPVARSQQALPNLKFGTDAELKEAESKLRAQIESNPQTRNLLKGTCLSLQLPQMVIADQGTMLDEVLLLGVQRAYAEVFPDRAFYNHLQGQLTGKMKFVAESRQDRLQAMMAQGPVNCLYFPNSLQGFGIEADREMMQYLPEGFMLRGVIDTAIALTAYTKVLARDSNAPVLDCAADVLCSFIPHDDSLSFSTRYLNADGSYAGGLLFVG